MDEQQVIMVYHKEKSLRKTADIFGVTPSAISYILNKHKIDIIKIKPKTNITRDEIIELLKSGKSKTQIAEDEGVSVTVITRRMAGYAHDKKHIIDKISKEQLEEAIRDGLTNEQIAKKFKCGTTSISLLINHYNIDKSQLPKKHIEGNRQQFPLTKEQLLDLHINQKLTLSEIGRRYNIKICWISSWMKANGIVPRTKPTQLVDISREDLEKDCKNGLSTRKIATKYNISKSLAMSKLKKFNLKTQPTLQLIKIKPIRERSESAQEISNMTKDKWKDSEYRNKVTEIMHSQKYRDKIRASLRNRWEDHEYQCNMAIIRSTQPTSMTKPHQKVCELLKSLKVDFSVEYLVGPWPFDIFVPSHNLLIEVQGVYRHTKDERIARDKAKSTYVTRYFPQYQIMYIWEYECQMEDKVLNKLKNRLRINTIELVNYNFNDIAILKPDREVADKFLYDFHYIHVGRHGLDVGGLIGDQLIVLARFTSPSRQESATSLGYEFNQVLELSRFCIHPNYHKHNLATWFLARTESFIPPAIKCLISFADTSQHVGTIYKAANWTLHSIVPPNYQYIDHDNWVMHKKVLWNHAQKLQMTEAEYANEFGYKKIWGMEKLKFIKKLER